MNWPLAFFGSEVIRFTSEWQTFQFNWLTQNKIIEQFNSTAFSLKNTLIGRIVDICHPSRITTSWATGIPSYVRWLNPLINTPGEILSGFFDITSYTSLIYTSLATDNKTPTSVQSIVNIWQIYTASIWDCIVHGYQSMHVWMAAN